MSLVRTKMVKVFVGGGHMSFTMYPAYRRAAWNQVAALRELARRHPEEYKGLMEATQAEEVIRR